MEQPVTHDPLRGEPRRKGEAGSVPCVSLLGVKVHSLDMDRALDIVRGYARGGEPHIVVTADASMIVAARDDEDLRSIVNSADLVTPDGSGILLGSKWLGRPLLDRVSGVDLSRQLCRMAAEDGFSVFLLGAAPGVAEEAARNLEGEFAGLKIAGTHHGYFSEAESAEIAAMVKQSGAGALLVALGIPRQEKWIRDHLGELGVGVAIGVGGTLDVFSGRVKRAPAWMQRHGLEWLYRLARNPRKIAKVATLPRFMALVLREKFFRGKVG